MTKGAIAPGLFGFSDSVRGYCEKHCSRNVEMIQPWIQNPVLVLDMRFKHSRGRTKESKAGGIILVNTGKDIRNLLYS